MKKTKVMKCQISSGQVEESGEYPSGECRQGVGTNSIKCSLLAVLSGYIRNYAV